MKYDHDETKRPGFKFAEHELQGVPVRVGIGMRDLEQGQLEVARRDTKEKSFVPKDGAADYILNLLDEIQENLLQRAKAHRTENTRNADSMEELEAILDGPGGFVSAHWDGTSETELAIKEQTKATIRCIPLDGSDEKGTCILTGKPSAQRVLFARAY